MIQGSSMWLWKQWTRLTPTIFLLLFLHSLELCCLNYWHGKFQHFYMERDYRQKSILEEKDCIFVLNLHAKQARCLFLFTFLCIWYVWKAYRLWGRGLKHWPLWLALHTNGRQICSPFGVAAGSWPVTSHVWIPISSKWHACSAVSKTKDWTEAC